VCAKYIARWDDVTGAVFLFVDFRGTIVFGGIMKRSEGPLSLLMLNMLTTNAYKSNTNVSSYY